MKENGSFVINKSLITIDAPDGSGKTTLSKHLLDYLNRYSNNSAMLVRPTRFEESKEALKFKERLSQRINLEVDSYQHNLYFLYALQRNYESLISPALCEGKVVITDSSEIRALAYVLDKGVTDAIESTKKRYCDGRLTNHILSGNRILLSTEINDCLYNIDNRNKNDVGDPKTIQEMNHRHNSYAESINFTKRLDIKKDVNWVCISNQPCEQDRLSEFLYDLIHEEIMPRLQ